MKVCPNLLIDGFPVEDIFLIDDVYKYYCQKIIFHFISFINMNRDANINIITGEIKKDYPLNSTSRRFSSQA